MSWSDMICGLTIGLLALVSFAGGYVENRTSKISEFARQREQPCERLE